jgi:hypothetical protein
VGPVNEILLRQGPRSRVVRVIDINFNNHNLYAITNSEFVSNLEAVNVELYPARHPNAELLRANVCHDNWSRFPGESLTPRAGIEALGFDWSCVVRWRCVLIQRGKYPAPQNASYPRGKTHLQVKYPQFREVGGCGDRLRVGKLALIDCIEMTRADAADANAGLRVRLAL